MLLLSLSLRLLGFYDPGGIYFPGAFGGYAFGELVQIIVQPGVWSSGLVPFCRQVEMAGGNDMREPYTHHQALFYLLNTPVVTLFGGQEWTLWLLPALSLERKAFQV